jgi:rhamnosyltransferase subunit B
MVNPILTLHEHSVSAPKYLVISFGTAGDMHPFLSLAKALQARGEDVTFMGFKAHEAMVLPLGIPFVPVGTYEDYFRVMHDPDLWHPRRGFATLFKHMGQDSQSMRDIAAHFQSLASDQALVVLAHPFAIPSTALFRQHLPLMRLVGVYLAPSNLRTVHDLLTLGELAVPRWLPHFVRPWMWRLVERFYIDPAAIPPLNAWRAQYDLPAIPQYMDHIYNEPDASLALFPAWFGKPQPDWPSPLLMGTFPLFEPDLSAQFSPELSQFLQAGLQPNDRPLVFAPGSAHAQAGSYFAKALKAVKRLGLRAIFLTPYPEQLPKALPASVLWQSYVPFDALLPKVRALVHHGGIGTTAQALRSGVPQLVVPFAFDQFDNAARVEALGCGLASLAEPRTTAFYLTRKIQKLLASEAIRAQCTATAARFANEPSMDKLMTRIG